MDLNIGVRVRIWFAQQKGWLKKNVRMLGESALVLLKA